MTYLLICEHRKMIVHDTSPEGASMQHRCQRCTDSDRRQLRVYRATPKDLEIVTNAEPETKRRFKATNQLDFTRP